MTTNGLSEAMQLAAVKAAQAEGRSLDEIAEQYPDLSEGVTAARKAAEKPPTRKASGPTKPLEVPALRGF